jgi:hypothetical protein
MTGQLYVGMPGNIDNPAAINITSSTATSPIEIATSSVHGLTTGDWVDIYGHTLNLPANCVDTQVTVIDTTHFTIPISGVGYTAGGATGVVVPLSYTQNIATIPADGDPYAAATYTPGYTAALDRSAFERVQTGAYKQVYFNTYKLQESFSTDWFTNSTNAIGVTVQALPGGTAPTCVASTDIYIVEMSFSFSVSTVSSVIVWIGCTWGNAGTVTKIPGSGQQLFNPSASYSGAGYQWNCNMRGVFTGDFGITAPQTVSPIGQISLLYQQSAANVTTFLGVGDFTVTHTVLRPTLIVQ